MSKQLQHVVLFQFKDSTTDEDIQQITTAFANLENEIDEVLSFEGGQDVSVEGLQNGFTVPQTMYKYGHRRVGFMRV